MTDKAYFPYEIERMELAENTGHLAIFAQGIKSEVGKGLDREDSQWIYQRIQTWLDRHIRKPMIPRHNEMQIRQHPNRICLSWKLSVQRNIRTFRDSISTLFSLGGWIFGEVFALTILFFVVLSFWHILQGNKENAPLGVGWLSLLAIFCFLLIWLIMWTRGGIASVLSLLSFFGPAPRTEVILKNDRMILRLLYARILPVGKNKIQASAIKRIAFEEIEGLPQIKVYLENEEFVIGETLIRSDREKLFGILQEWFHEHSRGIPDTTAQAGTRAG